MTTSYSISVHEPGEPAAKIHGSNAISAGTTTLGFGDVTLFFEDRDAAVDWLAKAALAIADARII